jgi:hypothetical protein
MDIEPTSGHYPGGIPKDPAKWEAYMLLGEQAMFGAPLSKRRQTVIGIPNLADFLQGHEERTRERMRRQNTNHSLPDDKEDFTHNTIHFGDDFLPPSLSSTTSSIKCSSSHASLSRKQHASAARHARHTSSSRPKLPEAYASAPEVPRPESPETFKRKIHEYKAHFYASQRTHSRPRHKSLLSSVLSDQPAQVLPPKPPPPPPPQPGLTPVTHYALWRQDCDQQLMNKSTMTHIPAPPISACSECANNSILGGQPTPIACSHSLDKILRTAITERPGSFAFSQAYFKILKSERQRWHTDRFGACNHRFKSRIEAHAQQLFILISDLLELEKLRMVETADMRAEHVPTYQPERTPDFFKFRPDKRDVW